MLEEAEERMCPEIKYQYKTKLKNKHTTYCKIRVINVFLKRLKQYNLYIHIYIYIYMLDYHFVFVPLPFNLKNNNENMITIVKL